MEISKLYEIAAEKLEKAIEVCGKNKMNLSSLTVISASSGNLYSGINWKTLNDSFEEELTSSEDEAIVKMILAGETAIESIVTLDPESKLPVNPCQSCLELILKINTANAGCNVLSGKNSKVILTSLNSEIAKFAAELIPAESVSPAAVSEDRNDTQQPQNAQSSNASDESSVPEGTAAQTGIDASGLQMIFDDWESSGEAVDTSNSKPFNASSLTSTQADQAEVVNQVQNMANNNGYPQQNGMYGNGMNGMNGQPMNGMYQQQNGGMYQQQAMYGQQPMNGMYGQPMNGMYGQPMNGMYGQPMNGMYGQPMNGMYGQPNGMYQQQNGGMYQQQPMNGMYQQQNGGRTSLYLNTPQQNPGAPQQPNNMYSNMPGAGTTSTYRSKLQAPVSHSVANTQSVSVYGTNISEGDNNAIFKDRLNNILNSGSSSKSEESDKMDVIMSAREKKNAAKKDAKKK